MRQTSGAMICPSCGKLIGVSEEKCPFCGAWRPGMFGYAPAIQKLFGRTLDVMSIISVACIVLYILSLGLQPEAIFGGSGFLSFLSPGSRALYQLGMTGGVAWREGWWWTLLTASFLHGGVMHIVFNLISLRNLGPAVTDAFGQARGFVIFMLSGAAGFLLSNVASGTPTIGASCSVYGLLAALIVYGRRRGATLLTAQLMQWAVVMFVLGFFMTGVNNWGHAGGFVGGWVVAQGMSHIDQRREGVAVQVLALLLLAATAVGVVLSFVRVTSILAGGG